MFSCFLSWSVDCYFVCIYTCKTITESTCTSMFLYSQEQQMLKWCFKGSYNIEVSVIIKTLPISILLLINTCSYKGVIGKNLYTPRGTQGKELSLTFSASQPNTYLPYLYFYYLWYWQLSGKLSTNTLSTGAHCFRADCWSS